MPTPAQPGGHDRAAPRGENAGRAPRDLSGLVRALPSSSVVEIGPVLNQARDILSQMGTAILAAASVAILAGMAVLAGAIAAARERRYDNVILRVLGAGRRQLLTLILAEYALLCAVLAAIALALGCGAGWLVIVRLFDFAWMPGWTRILAVLGAGVRWCWCWRWRVR
jgi:putative ABC transport system permease protein